MNNIIRKTISVLIAIVLAVSCFSINAFAEEKSVDIRQVNVNLPSVSVEVEGNYSKEDVESLKLDGESLTVSDVYKGTDADSNLVYMLIDISTSMSQSALNAVKPSLIDFANSLGKKDKLVLMTFGTEVKTLLSGGESSKEISNTINSLKCNSQGTTFYKALTKALDDSIEQNNYVRKYAIVVSDGADYDKGNSSQQEVVNSLESNRLPIYGLCVSTSSSENMNGFGYICRESGGELEKLSSSNAKSNFNSLKKIIDNVTVIKAKSKKKKSSENKELTVKLNGVKNTAKETVVVNAKNDDEKPTVEDITFDKDTNSFKLYFSENVDNADDSSSYVIKKGSKELSIVSVIYDSDDKTSTINMDKKVYSGTYTFEMKNITDATDNQNELDKSSYEWEIKANPIILKILTIVAIILIPVLFLVALYLILLNLKKRKKVDKIKDIFITQVEEKEYEHIHIDSPKGMALKLYIDAGNGRYHNVDFNLVNSMIIGRSDMCDLTIDDKNMSRQHFVIEQVDNGLAVTDLNTTNGTFVNGIQIHSRTFVPTGAKVMAGNSLITINY
jgi:hypothetical protein